MDRDTPVHVERDVLVAMRDGVRLATDVFRPTASGPYPVVLKRTPYGKKQTALMAAPTIADLVDHGYAVVVQDVRGRFNSEGCWTPFACEINDGYDAVAWAASQAWSNGRVGMFGSSYLGLTQLLAAAARPPALKAIAPINTASDLHQDWVYNGDGVLDLQLSVGWSAVLVADTAKRAGVHDSQLAQIEQAFGALLHALASDPQAARAASSTLRTALDPLFDDARANATLTELAPWLAHWLAYSRADAYWCAQSPATYYRNMAAPALHVTGWYDAFATGVIANYVGMREQAATGDVRRGQRLTIGPWVHASFEPCPPHAIGDLDFGAAADIDLPELQRRWFDYWLKGQASGALEDAPVRLFVMGANCWRDEQAWPLARTRWTQLYLRTGGLASFAAPDREEAAATCVVDPRDPVPTLGGAVLPGAILAGPVDQRANDDRPDVLKFVSAPLAEAVEATGHVSARLWVTSSASEADFIARLIDVHPDGRAMNLCEGIRHVRVAGLTPVDIDMHVTSNVFKPGHRIRVDVASSSYPHYQSSSPAARHSIVHDAQHPAHVLLPVNPR